MGQFVFNNGQRNDGDKFETPVESSEDRSRNQQNDIDEMRALGYSAESGTSIRGCIESVSNIFKNKLIE